MSENDKSYRYMNGLYLNKWFLDFIGENGEAMIFYAANLNWGPFSVPYTSWIHYDPEKGVNETSRYRKINLPVKDKNQITWNDNSFKIKGLWESRSAPLEARLFDSKEGYLDWRCYQPASDVQLEINNHPLKGKGYAEQLILTVAPWKIPMDELRWGRWISEDDTIVWIEIRKDDKKQWLWVNGEQIEHSYIENDHLEIPVKNLKLRLNHKLLLESEKKISTVMDKLHKYLPGFRKIIPIRFLRSDEKKWLSNGILHDNYDRTVNGMAIHEFVNFKPEGL
jgi:hypothetical protein